MALTTCREMVAKAYREGYAVAQLNTNGGDYHLTRAILEAAESKKSPVILGVYERNATYAGLSYVAKSLTLLIQEHAPSVPVAIHLDHGSGFAVCAEAVRAGFTSIMYDGSKESLAVNIAVSDRVCELAHAVGMTFEAELGRLLNGESDPDNPNLVSVDDVREFTRAVPVDMLAVAIGNSHGFYKDPPRLNTARLEEVRDAVDIPLVLHGTTGLPEGQIGDCIRLGMAKVNLGTILRTDYIEFYRRFIDEIDHQGHPWRVGRAVKDALVTECAAFFETVGSAGKA